MSVKHLFFAFALLPGCAFAFDSANLWSRPDQREARAITAGNRDYLTQKWREAEVDYAKGQTATAHYNRGNALAHVGKIQEAITAYEDALRLNPNNQDAKYNRDLLKKLAQQSPPSSQNQQKPDQKSSPQDPSKDKTSPENTPSPPPSKSKVPPPTVQSNQREQADRWLNQVADDPGGLLRQKFLRDHQRQLVEGKIP